MFITNSFKFMATVFTIDKYNQMDPNCCLDNYICVLFCRFFSQNHLFSNVTRTFGLASFHWICVSNKYQILFTFRMLIFLFLLNLNWNRIKITSSNIVGKTWQRIFIFFYYFIYLDIKFPKSRALECLFSVSHSLWLYVDIAFIIVL